MGSNNWPVCHRIDWFWTFLFLSELSVKRLLWTRWPTLSCSLFLLSPVSRSLYQYSTVDTLCRYCTLRQSSRVNWTNSTLIVCLVGLQLWLIEAVSAGAAVYRSIICTRTVHKAVSYLSYGWAIKAMVSEQLSLSQVKPLVAFGLFRPSLVSLIRPSHPLPALSCR